MMELWVATTNQGKLREIERILADQGVAIHSIKELPAYSAPPETGTTFVENARIKAKSMRSIKNDVWVMGEDSGLEVEGLNGMPGVHSARYAGQNAKDTENTLRVLKMLNLKGAANRNAKFRSTIVLYSPSGEESVFEGQVEGLISKDPRGTEGFGYDAIFIPKGESKTFGELGLAFKNKVSHRSEALRKMLEFLKTKL
jgi:XTP/dITP diphosphohydrolase